MATKVLHVTKASGVSGSERHLLTLLPGLRERGVECSVAVLATEGSDAFVDALQRVGVPAIPIAAGPDVSPATVWRLRQEIHRVTPDIVHTHLIHADLHGQIAARLAGVPGVSTVHSSEDFYRRQPYRSAAWIAGHLAKQTIAISQYVAQTVRESRVAPSDRVRVIHYGISTSLWVVDETGRTRARHELGLRPDDVAVGVASRLIPGKGHQLLVKAVAEALRGGARIRLLVAGDGPLRPDLEGLAAAEGVGAQVTFVGFVNSIGEFMAACDIIAFPTQPEFGEGFGLAALEAMATGRAVVGTRVASVPEVVADGETGLLVEPGDVSGFAAALVQLSENRELCARLGEGGRRRAVERFSLDAMVAATLSVYDAVGG